MRAPCRLEAVSVAAQKGRTVRRRGERVLEQDGVHRRGRRPVVTGLAAPGLDPGRRDQDVGVEDLAGARVDVGGTDRVHRPIGGGPADGGVPRVRRAPGTVLGSIEDLDRVPEAGIQKRPVPLEDPRPHVRAPLDRHRAIDVVGDRTNRLADGGGRILLFQPPAVHVADEEVVGRIAGKVLEGRDEIADPFIREARAHRRGRQLQQGVVDADRDRAVVRHGLQAQAPRALVREPDLSLEVRGEEPYFLKAGAPLVQRDVSGHFPGAGGGLEDRGDVGPIGEQERRQVDQHLLRRSLPGGGDGEGIGDGMTERVGDGPGHGRARLRREVRVDHPELDPIGFPVEPDQLGTDTAAAVEPELADSLGELSDEQEIAVQLRSSQGEKDSLLLIVDREQAGPDHASLGHVGVRFSRLVLRQEGRGNEGEKQPELDYGAGKDHDKLREPGNAARLGNHPRKGKEGAVRASEGNLPSCGQLRLLPPGAETGQKAKSRRVGTGAGARAIGLTQALQPHTFRESVPEPGPQPKA